MSERSALSKSLMEFVGTFILVCTIQTSSMMIPLNAPGAVCGMLSGLIYMGFELSGAHYNPAVTLVFFLRNLIPVSLSLQYVVMQLVGGILGASFATVIVPGTRPFQPGTGVSLSQAVYGELFFTFALCFSVLTIALRKNIIVNPVVGIAITGVIYAGANVTGSISGAAFNPAVAISLAVVNHGNLNFALMVSLTNLTAAILATAVFYAVAPEEMTEIPWISTLRQRHRRVEQTPLLMDR